MRLLAFMNNKGGVGKTTLAYHVAWMLSEIGYRVLVVDLDPQANLTSMFLAEDRLEEIWPEGSHPETVAGAFEPIEEGLGDFRPVATQEISDGLFLVPGDLALARIEDRLSLTWSQCLDRDKAAFRVQSGFYRMALTAGRESQADVVVIDVGPNLGAINRSALLSADGIVIPLAADLFSLQGLRNLGPQLERWRGEWSERLARVPRDLAIELPPGRSTPLGYVVLQHAVRADRPVKAYARWTRRIPSQYAEDVLGVGPPDIDDPSEDPNCLGMLKNYRSLMPLAQDALKPMFSLTSADGALGAHLSAVAACHDDFETLSRRILFSLEQLQD